MKRKSFLFVFLTWSFLISGNLIFSQSLTSLTAASGSLAPWGENQGISIDASGNTTVLIQDIETGITQTSTLVLTTNQMQAINDTAIAAGFFSLSPLYDSGALDGSGITMEIITSSSSNTVEVRNSCVEAMNRVVRTINLQILSTGKQLNYGYLNDVCP